MTQLSIDEISRQLNILSKKIDALQANGAITEAAESLSAAATVGIGKLQNQLPDLLSQLKNGISQNSDIAVKLTEVLPGGLDQLNNLFAAAEPALQELGKLNLLQDFGPAIGGMQALMKSAEEAIDDAQDQLPKLLREAKPVLTKLDQSMEQFIPELKNCYTRS